MELAEKRDLMRKIMGAVTATLDSERVARVEALRLMELHPKATDLGDLVDQYELTIAALLQVASGMVALAGAVQSAYTPEELLQKLALAFEERWAS
jgi:hypothetical protein